MARRQHREVPAWFSPATIRAPRIIESQASSRGVAQPGSAPAWGAGGRGFESRRPDHFAIPEPGQGPARGTGSGSGRIRHSSGAGVDRAGFVAIGRTSHFEFTSQRAVARRRDRALRPGKWQQQRQRSTSSLLPSGEGGAQRRMRERSRTIPGAANRSILPSSAFGTFSRREKETAAEQAALREANAGDAP